MSGACAAMVDDAAKKYGPLSDPAQVAVDVGIFPADTFIPSGAMMFTKMNFKDLLGTPGFSDALLTDHFALYEGYVTHANKFAELIKAAEPGTPILSELTRRFGWEYNGMRLHEFYFESMSRQGSKLEASSLLMEQLKADFGSYEAWEKDFKTIGAMRGIGWAMLVYGRREKRLFNIWVDEHNAGHLAGSQPILTLDVFEHAYIKDYGLKRPDYIAAFMKAVNWEGLQKAFENEAGTRAETKSSPLAAAL